MLIFAVFEALINTFNIQYMAFLSRFYIKYINTRVNTPTTNKIKILRNKQKRIFLFALCAKNAHIPLEKSLFFKRTNTFVGSVFDYLVDLGRLELPYETQSILLSTCLFHPKFPLALSE